MAHGADVQEDRPVRVGHGAYCIVQQAQGQLSMAHCMCPHIDLDQAARAGLSLRPEAGIGFQQQTRPSLSRHPLATRWH